MTPDRLSGLDSAFLSLERDIAPLQLGALAIFRSPRPVSGHAVADLLAQRVSDTPRLRRTLRRSWFPPGSAEWYDDPRFEPENHVHLHHLDSGPLQAAAAELAGRVMAAPLPRDRPLWELHVVAGADGCRFGVLVKLHHAFADGLGALEIGLSLLDDAARKRAADSGAGPAGDLTGSVGAVGSVNSGGSAGPAGSVGFVGGASGSGGSSGRRLADGLRRFAADAVGNASEVLGIAGSVLRGVRLPATDSPLLVTSSGRRGLALARMDLDQVRRIRLRHGGTANDVMLAVVTGALRDWLVRRGDPVDGMTLRALIPVSSRARAGQRAASNRMSGYLCALPVGESDPLVRLRAVRECMEANKAAGTRRGPGAVPLLADQVPALVHRVAGPAASQAAALLFDLLLTSVPVPGRPLCLAGAELEEIYPLAPLAAGHGLGIAMSSYRGRAFVGLHADREALPDVDALAAAIPVAADELDGLS